MRGARDDLVQVAHHLAAVADTERKRVAALEKGGERVAQPDVDVHPALGRPTLGDLLAEEPRPGSGLWEAHNARIVFDVIDVAPHAVPVARQIVERARQRGHPLARRRQRDTHEAEFRLEMTRAQPHRPPVTVTPPR